MVGVENVIPTEKMYITLENIMFSNGDFGSYGECNLIASNPFTIEVDLTVVGDWAAF